MFKEITGHLKLFDLMDMKQQQRKLCKKRERRQKITKYLASRISHERNKTQLIHLIQLIHHEKGEKTWSTTEVFSTSGMIREHLLFVHAWSGCCNTSSSTYGEGNSTFVNLLKKSGELQSASKTTNPCSTRQEVRIAANKII